MIEKLRGALYTTVVGSFPYRVDKTLTLEDDWSKTKEVSETSFQALEFQLDCGIEYPSDGQFFDMTTMYLEPLKASGFLKEDRSIGEESPPKTHPSLELEKMLERNARQGGALGIRVPITGPFTLAYRVKTDGKNLVDAGDLDGLRRLGTAVKNYCQGFDNSLKGSLLSVDEPVLPFVLPTFGEDFIREVLNDLFAAIKSNYTCMHVCGEIASIKDLALSLGVDILDHEFQGTKNNGVYSKADLEGNKKLLSYGLLNTNPRQVISEDGIVKVESVDELTSSLESACKSYGAENLILSPDCGFGGWKHTRLPDEQIWHCIEEKLSNMVKARDNFLGKQV
jgi:5-methyltetrahydropteroyltriglutamate--homocysteine methyltransferase